MIRVAALLSVVALTASCVTSGDELPLASAFAAPDLPTYELRRVALLPFEGDGYYREYTVVTPGSSDRGARRIVTGARGEVFYTADHYGSFVEVVDADV